MDLSPFYFGSIPRILFGEGRLAELPALVQEQGRRALLVIGQSSLRAGPLWPRLCSGLTDLGVEWQVATVAEEPSPQLVDRLVTEHRPAGVEVVVGIGGGSVLDAAKAVAALLPFGNSVLDHLEDVGRGIPYQGPSLPLIAVPTTAGTGSEATRNAVLSLHGAQGYKKSFRHESMVPRVALVDPTLLASCPPALIAAQGMDAFTQLLESYLSLRASPVTDALALSGLSAFRSGFFDAWRGGEGAAACQGRAAIAYAALLSGITLAQAGLGSVHGLAQPLGSLFPVPHGVACGSVVAAATAANVQALRARPQGQGVALAKYANVGRLLCAGEWVSDAAAVDALLALLAEWSETLALPRLGHYGIGHADIDRIVAASRNNSMKSNPIVLTDAEIAAVVQERL